MSSITQAPITSRHRLLTLDDVLQLLGERALAFLDADRCTIFIHDAGTKQLWSRVAAGGEVKEIRIPENAGLAGESFSIGSIINVPDAYADARFNRDVDRRTGYRTQTILCCPILRPDTSRVGVIQVLNKRTGPFTAHDESLLDVFSGQAAITLQNALAEEALQVARAKEKELSVKLAENHEKLQNAFRDLNAQKDSLEALMRRQRVMRRIAAGAAALVAVIMAWVLFGPRVLAARSAATVVAAAAGDAPVETRPMQSTLSLVGTLEPIRTATLASPFAGRLRSLLVKPGDRVIAGQPLAELERTQIENELRDLEGRFIEARARRHELESWSSSRDVANVRRNLNRTRNELEHARVNLANSKLLFERGVISENERRSAADQVTNLEAQLAGAEEDLAATLKRGDPDSVRIALNACESLEQEIARKRANRDRATVRAPHDGVVLRPPASLGVDKPMAPGRDLTEGETVLLVGQLDGFRVRAMVDEADVLQLRPRQSVVVTGAAFPGITLAGEIAVVSSQGTADGAGTRFDLEIVVPRIPDEARGRVLLGMSADLRVEVYHNDQAVVVPLAAVQGTEGAFAVSVRLADGRTESRAIRTGVTSEGAVEVTDGLKPGEKVVLYR